MPIEPALTPIDWQDYREHKAEGHSRGLIYEMIGGGPHHMAAIALEDQPFGFTWEDVDELRAFGTFGNERWEDLLEVLLRRAERYHDLADRLEALLPPRETQGT